MPQADTAPPLAIVAATTQSKCAPSEGEEIVVCGRTDQEQFRIRPLPQLKSEPGFLHKPLAIEIAPNVHVGFLGGGLGVKAEF